MQFPDLKNTNIHAAYLTSEFGGFSVDDVRFFCEFQKCLQGTK